jgi:LemA protein
MCKIEKQLKRRKMKKGLIVLLVVAAVVLGIFFWFQGNYNRMVKMDEGVQAAWSQVENVYQRRADLIPNLVATVKGYASHEQQTLEGVISARSKATQITVNPEDLTSEQMEKFQKAQGELGSALGKLLAITENYPDLKANTNFLELQAQLEGTENRIAVERKKFNDAARVYNTTIRQFPKNIVAGMFGFEKKPYFEAAEGAQEAPKVEF